MSSFGFGGTNAHLVIEEPPADSPSPAPSIPEKGKVAELSLPDPEGVGRPLHVLPLSAPTPAGLQELAGVYRQHIEQHPDLCLADLCHTAGAGRSHFRHRLAIVGDSLAHASDSLASVADGRQSTGAIVGDGGAEPPKIAFLFTGQGAQHVAMGQELYESQPVFRETIRRCDELLSSHLDRPLRELLYPPAGAASPLDETAYTQPALFALEVALAEVWKSWGIVPDAVMGHSLGEYVAAYVAGVFRLEEGLRLVAARARLMQSLPRDGSMAAVLADPRYVRQTVERHAPELAIAADNGPQNTVISGRSLDVATIVRCLQSDRIESRPLTVSHAFHSPLVEPVLAELGQVATSVAFARPEIELVSNLTGRPVDEELCDPDYWCRHARHTVRFADSIRGLWARGYRVFVEAGPKPVLLNMARHCVPEEPADWLPSLRPGRTDWQQLLETLAALYVRGARVRWEEFDRYQPCLRLRLPTYPFRRRRYWGDIAPPSGRQRLGAATPTGHPLLGERIDCARHREEVLFQSVLSRQSPAFLGDHIVFGEAVLPAAGYLEMAWAAGAQVFGTEQLAAENVQFHQALILSDPSGRTVQFSLDRRVGSFQVHSRDAAGPDSRQAEWTLHASGTIHVADAAGRDRAPSDSPVDLAALREKNSEPVRCGDFYRGYRDRGVEFGPAFQAVKQIWRSDAEVVGELARAEDLAGGDRSYHLHPVLLDACAQLVGAARRFSCTTCSAETAGDDAAPAPEVWLQTGVDRFRAFGRPSGRLWGHARLRSAPGEPTLVADVRLLDNAGTVLAEVIGQQAQRVNQERLLRPAAASAGSFYEVRWLPRPRTHSSVAQVAGLQASQGSAQALAHSATCQEHAAAWQGAGSTLTGEVRELLSQGLDAQVAQPEIVSYAALLKELESLSVLYIGRALTRMGWSQRPGDRLAADDLIRGLRVQATRTRLFGRLLEILAAEGCLRREGKQWEVLSELPGCDLPQELDRIRRQYPAPQAELDLLDRCGSNLADVLQGRCDPLELISPGGDLTTATRVYHDSPGARAINSVLREGVRRAVERLPVDARLRVLEIGAGTGGATAYVLPALPADRVEEYVFTDISRQFLSAAKEKFAEYPFVRFEVLDIERSPAEQGFADAKFDMVVASNVLHATRHLSTTVRHASQLMAAGGLLWLLENTAPSRWVDLIWGLTDGWWRFDDPWRTSQPLLDTEGWRRLLRENGCPTVECIAAYPRRHEVVSRQTILLAQRAAGPSPSAAATKVGQGSKTWLLMADGEGDLSELSEMLSARGQSTVRVAPGPCYTQRSETEFTVAPADAADVVRVLQRLSDRGDLLRGVVFARGLATGSASCPPVVEWPATALSACTDLVHLVQSLASVRWEPRPRLWIVTRAAQPVMEDASRLRLWQSPLWGIGKVIALEHPELWGGMVDLDPSPAPGEFAAVLDEIQRPDGEDVVALRGQQRFAARLVPSDLQRRVPTSSHR